MEEVGGVGAGVLDLRFQRTAGRHQRLHPLHDRGLFGEGWERDDKRLDFSDIYMRSTAAEDRFIGDLCDVRRVQQELNERRRCRMMRAQKHHPLAHAQFFAYGNPASDSEDTAFTTVENIVWLGNEALNAFLIRLP